MNNHCSWFRLFFSLPKIENYLSKKMMNELWMNMTTRWRSFHQFNLHQMINFIKIKGLKLRLTLPNMNSLGRRKYLGSTIFKALRDRVSRVDSRDWSSLGLAWGNCSWRNPGRVTLSRNEFGMMGNLRCSNRSWRHRRYGGLNDAHRTRVRSKSFSSRLSLSSLSISLSKSWGQFLRNLSEQLSWSKLTRMNATT